MKYYSGDWHYNENMYSYHEAFTCEGFDRPWNGWATPVVTREQLQELVDVENDLSVTADGHLVYVSPDYALDDIFVIHPDEKGLYHLVDLGWCFDEVSEDDYNDSL